jgi:hypothetical protein
MPDAINNPPGIGTCPLPLAPAGQAPAPAGQAPILEGNPTAAIQEVASGGSGSTNGGARARHASDTTTIGGDSRQSTFTL